MTSIDFLMIAIGGFFGAIIRYVISITLNRSGEIPRGTLVVNLAGALVIGFVFGMEIPLMWTLLVASGLAGALTTFSTMNKELIELWRNDQKKHAVNYLLYTYGGGLGLVVVGYVVGGSLR